jgi:DNA polymerase IV
VVYSRGISESFTSMAIRSSPRARSHSINRCADGAATASSSPLNYLAKKCSITTGMVCFEAKRACPDGVLVRPHYDEYRRLSLELFKRVRQYTPLLVPTSIDEGFVDFTDSPRVFRCRNAEELVARMKREIVAEVGVPVSAGLGPFDEPRAEVELTTTSLSCSAHPSLAGRAGRPDQELWLRL